MAPLLPRAAFTLAVAIFLQRVRAIRRTDDSGELEGDDEFHVGDQVEDLEAIVGSLLAQLLLVKGVRVH